MTTATTATCKRCGVVFTYSHHGRQRPKEYCTPACRDQARIDRMAAGRLTPKCKRCEGLIDTGPTGGRRRTTYCSDSCKEAARAERLKAEHRANRAGRVCLACGGPIPEELSMRAKTCSAVCGDRYQNERRAEAARKARRARTRPPCVVCGAAIDPERRLLVKYCTEACRTIARSQRYRAANPDWQQTYRYEMTPGQYDAMLAIQGGRCAVCGATEAGGKGGRFHVDHDHATGEIRGLLCNRCNIALGLMDDDKGRLQAAMEYLHRPPARRLK